MPVIIGHTKDEGLYAVTEVLPRHSPPPSSTILHHPHQVLARTPTAASLVLEDWELGKGPSWVFGREEDEASARESQIAMKFLDEFLEGGRSREPLVLQNWFTQSVWTAATLRTSALLARGRSTPTYEYFYTHPGRLSLSDLLSFPLWKLILKLLAAKVNLDIFYNTLDAATHFDEIFLLFRGHDIPFLQRHSAEDEAVGRMMVSLWTSFAKELAPTAGSVAWEARGAADPGYLEIGTRGATMRNHTDFAAVMDFFEELWAEVPPRMHLQRSPTWANPDMYGEVPYRPVKSLSSYSPSPLTSSASPSSTPFSPSSTPEL